MRGLLIAFFLFSVYFVYGGTIHSIAITGNKITKRNIILRELTFKIGDSVDSSSYEEKITQSQRNLLNCTLFNFATVEFIDSLSFINVRVNVVERWYLWPEVIIKFQDRNFTEWWKTKNFSRIDYGLNITRKNFRGRQESLQLQLKYGFNRKVGIHYERPYLNKKMKDGFKVSVSYNTQNEVFTSIEDNNKMYYLKNPESILLETYNVHFEYTRRNNFYTRHYLKLDYTELHLKSFLIDFKNEFLAGKQRNQFVTLTYWFRKDHRDSRNYPLNGYYFDCELKQNGIGIDQSNINVTSLNFNYKKFFYLTSKMYYATSVYAKFFSKSSNPFYFQDGLGFNQYVRGYEPYVIFGQINSVMKNNFKFQLLKPRSYKIPLIKSERFSRMHFAYFCNVFVDMGYVYQPKENSKSLNNSLLMGAGIGIDFVTFYDLVWRAEYSINKDLLHGLYISFVAPI